MSFDEYEAACYTLEQALQNGALVGGNADEDHHSDDALSTASTYRIADDEQYITSQHQHQHQHHSQYHAPHRDANEYHSRRRSGGGDGGDGGDGGRKTHAHVSRTDQKIALEVEAKRNARDHLLLSEREAARLAEPRRRAAAAQVIACILSLSLSSAKFDISISPLSIFDTLSCLVYFLSHSFSSPLSFTQSISFFSTRSLTVFLYRKRATATARTRLDEEMYKRQGQQRKVLAARMRSRRDFDRNTVALFHHNLM